MLTSRGTMAAAGIGAGAPAALSRRSRALAAGLVVALGCFAAGIGWLADAPTGSGASAPAEADVRQLLGELRFEANRGQVAGGTDFVARGLGYAVSLSSQGAAIGLDRRGARAVVGMSVLGASDRARAAGVGPVTGRSNYLIGADPSRWRRNVPSFARVRYAGVYPGIDVVYRGNRERLEYDFVVAPGGDPRDIALAFRGGRVSLAPGGDLLVRARGGVLRQKRPFSFQRIGGATRKVESRFVVGARGRVTFGLGSYDRSRPLVIDPELVYSTYLGGGAQGEGMGGPGAEVGEGVAVDAQGNAYVAGATTAVAPSPFPTRGPFQGVNGGGADAFVTKVNPSGGGIVYSTYLGGGGADRAFGIAVNAAGEAHVTGQTLSGGTTPFPTRAPFQATNAGDNDVFVAKLNAAGDNLVYSTYLGGTASDRSFGIALDAASAAHVTGYTASANFPTQGAIDASHNGADDAFVTKLAPNGSALTYSTFLGGAGADGAEGIAVHQPTGDAYLSGATASAAFPVTPGAFQTTRPAAAGNTRDGFVSRVRADGSALVYSSFLGGSGIEQSNGVAVDAAGAAYLVGSTSSDDFPVQAALQGARGSAVAGVDDVFVTKLNAAGSAAVYSTYFGGRGFDLGNAIAVDAAGAAHVVGTADGASDVPLVSPAGRGSGSEDLLVFKLNPAGSAVAYSTLLGGTDGDQGFGVAVDPAGAAYAVGRANAFASPPGNFPTTPGAFLAPAPGGSEVFVAKVAATPGSPLVTSLRARSGPVTGGTRVTIGGTGFTGATAVRFGSTPAARFTVESDTRISAVSPVGAVGKTTVTVTTPAGTTPANPVAAFEYAEGTWTQTGSLIDAHYAAPLVQLADGRVLLPSGMATRGGPTVGSSEVYDPKARSWAKTADMATSRHAHTATLLSGPACRRPSPPAYCGRVLATGGFALGVPSAAAQPVLDGAELYDPGTGTWAATGTMAARRGLHAATLLDGPPCRAASPPAYCGKVLVVGGRTCDMPSPAGCPNTQRLSSAELYDPATGTWTATGSMRHQRYNFELATLPDGGVLAVAGFGSDTTSAEVYDPATGSWGITDPLRTRTRASAAALPDGRVIAVSGFGAGNTVDLFDPVSRTWRPAANMIASYRFNYNYATLPSGKVLFAGGSSGGESSEAYDPVADRWISTGLMNAGPGPLAGPGDTQATVVLSSDPDGFAFDAAKCGADCGKVIVAGSTDDRTAELYTPPPAVEAISPTRGTAAGGAAVTITGQGFTHGVRSVRFGDAEATGVRVDSYGRLTATAPPHAAGSVTITVVNEGGAASVASGFAYSAVAASPGPQQSATFAGCPSASSNVIRGTAGKDALVGSALGDRIFAGAGDDTADGRAGADCIDLGAGADRGVGGLGADLVLGGSGADRLTGGSGADRLTGGSGADRLTGGSGADRLTGGAGRDNLSAGAGNDRISARDGQRDTITCGKGRDRVTADRIDRVARGCERVRKR